MKFTKTEIIISSILLIGLILSFSAFFYNVNRAIKHHNQLQLNHTKEAYDNGIIAKQAGVSTEANPYQEQFQKKAWLDGWIKGCVPSIEEQSKPKNDPFRNPTSKELLEDEPEIQETFGISFNENKREDLQVSMLERWKKKGCK